MENEISVDMTRGEWGIIIRSLEEFKKGERYPNFGDREKDDFDELVERIKGRLEEEEE